jgi:hypothetical protein
MNFEQKLNELKERQSKITDIKKEVLDLSSNIFEDFYKYIFEKYPTLESFGWTQYTPYFNDGDATIFSVNTDYISINDEYVDDAKWASEVNVINWGTWNRELKVYEGRVDEPNTNYDPILTSASNEITNFLGNFDNEFYLSKFGDHAEITVTRNGVDISDYDHD